MQTVITKSPHLLTWVVDIPLILFCLVGITAIVWWIPESFGNPANNAAAARLLAAPTNPVIDLSGDSSVLGAVRGVVAVNEIEKRVGSSKHYETTVRFGPGVW